LDPVGLEADGLGFSLAPGAGKEATFVLKPFHLDHERAREWCLAKDHE
jgi:hypothetical protein